VSLAPDFAALETTGYTSRGDFLGRLETILDALEEHVGPALVPRRRFDEFIALVGAGPGRTQRERLPLSAEARAARAPLPPEVLADARQDTVHRDVGRGRAARTVKAKRRGRK